MRRIYICFPEGNYKVLTLSYDDGKITDRRLVDILNQNGIKGTFHLNSGYLGEKEGHSLPYITKEEAVSLYRGHEIASHRISGPGIFLSEWGARSKAARPSAKLRNCVWKDDKEHPSF